MITKTEIMSRLVELASRYLDGEISEELFLAGEQRLLDLLERPHEDERREVVPWMP